MKNYYELLEVSKNASPEVIEKAYKTLVKKYHPDLQPDSKKKEAENKLKEINEAYEILSDLSKKENYDKLLNMEKIKNEQAKYANSNRPPNTNTYNNQSYNTSQSNNTQKRVIHPPHVTYTYVDFSDFPKDFNGFDEFKNPNTNYTKIMNDIYNNAYNNAYNTAFNQAYFNQLNNMGNNFTYKKTFKERFKFAISFVMAIFTVIILGIILWHIPFIKNYFIDLYNNNEIIKFFIDFAINIVSNFINLFKKT